MFTKKVLILLGTLILTAVLFTACAGPEGPQGPAGPAGPTGSAGPAGPAGAPAESAVPVAASKAVQFESCNGCHEGAGDTHQKYYDMLYQDGVIQVTDVAYKFNAGAGGTTDTTVVTFKMTKDGKPISGASVENSNIYFAAYTGTTFEGAGRLSLKGKLSYDDKTGVTTSTLAELASTDKAYIDYVDESKVDGVLVVYGYDKQVGSLPARIKQVQFPYAAMLKIGKVDYASAANNDGCEKCHTDPYLKHGNIYAQVGGDPATDFITCKVCHLDNGEGGHFEWQLTADDPEAGAEFLAAGEGAATDEIKAKYGYKTTLMNDVHMSHAMEFPYPQSMSNCVTCHEGKLDKVLSDANFNGATCKSCHPVTGSVKKDGDTVIFDTTTYALATILPSGHDLNSDCTACHGEGKAAPAFNKIHTGYDKSIYLADGTRISDVVKVAIDDKAAYGADANTLTFSFGQTSSRKDLNDFGLDLKTMKPTVLVSLYGYNTKDFLVGGHERLKDDNGDGTIDSKDGRAMELVLDGEAQNPRVTMVSFLDGKWIVSVDLSDWKDQIKNGSIKRAEIAVLPALSNADGVVVALDAVSRTFDIGANKFNDKFYGPISNVNNCESCHDALGTTFHSPDRGGNLVVCRMCHITKSGGSHLELQSRSLDSYIHAIHSSQQFDIADVDFTDPAQAEKFMLDSELPFPKHGVTDCESCHNPGTYNVPNQSKSLPGILSASENELKGKTRNIANIPSYVTGPASRACGSCHRAELINEDEANGIATFNAHIAQYGYMVEAGDKPVSTLESVWTQIMGLFK